MFYGQRPLDPLEKKKENVTVKLSRGKNLRPGWPRAVGRGYGSRGMGYMGGTGGLEEEEDDQEEEEDGKRRDYSKQM